MQVSAFGLVENRLLGSAECTFRAECMNATRPGALGSSGSGARSTPAGHLLFGLWAGFHT
jgi:hypothetical protein